MNALVLGGADCLWDDLRALGPWDGIVIGVNDAGAVYPHRIDHFATLHPEKLPGWKAERAKRGGNLDFVTWSSRANADQVDRTVCNWCDGSSGMLAVRAALVLGADMIVLAGVPMGREAHFFDDKPWGDAHHFRQVWEDRANAMRGRVYSMSGWTRQLLGAPPFLQTSEAA